MLCEGHHEVLHNCNEWRTGQRPGSNGWPQWLWLTTVVICFLFFLLLIRCFLSIFVDIFPQLWRNARFLAVSAQDSKWALKALGPLYGPFRSGKGERVCWFQVRRRARPSEIALVGGFKSLYIIDYYSMIVLKTQWVWDNWVWGAAYKNQTWLAQNPLPACHVYSIYIHIYIHTYIYIYIYHAAVEVERLSLQCMPCWMA